MPNGTANFKERRLSGWAGANHKSPLSLGLEVRDRKSVWLTPWFQSCLTLSYLVIPTELWANRWLLFFLIFFNVVKYTFNLPFEPFWSIQLNGIKHIHTIVQVSPPSVSRMFLSSQDETLPLLNNKSPCLPTNLLETNILLSYLYKFDYSRYSV